MTASWPASPRDDGPGPRTWRAPPSGWPALPATMSPAWPFPWTAVTPRHFDECQPPCRGRSFVGWRGWRRRFGIGHDPADQLELQLLVERQLHGERLQRHHELEVGESELVQRVRFEQALGQLERRPGGSDVHGCGGFAGRIGGRGGVSLRLLRLRAGPRLGRI